ncbi:integrin alpha-11 isoform X1 [Oncorhynchus tshawytscha]|uniref:VWFA domain-containing protein n=2 Tax=Oncorhynchus tshawytscha TaxID=74940 RepID=A0A8C8JL59_ONCTS|nr:integrin alpha-11 isoform X1 [Oncorhynchus tshawytscha]
MEYYCSLLLWTCALLPGLLQCFNFDTKKYKIIEGSKEAQFGYTVQQHEAGGQKWLLVGAPFETSGQHQTGDIYKCPMDTSPNTNCTRLNLGKVSLNNVSERKDKMRLGMTLTSNPKDNSFVTCGPLWSYECGSSYYSTGICSRVNESFKFSKTISPAFQRCETYMDIMIVLDGSNSIYPWYEVQDFLINILQKFYIGPGQIQVGVVQYGSRVVHEFTLNDFRSVEEVVEAAKTIDQRGGEETRTALGINVARTEGFKRGGRKGAKKVMLVITDGESHDSPDLQKAMEDTEADNITMYAIAVLGYYNRRGINPEAFLKEIKYIASDPDDKHFFNVTDESALKDIVDALGERIFSLEGVNPNGTGFGLQMSQAGFSSHIVEDGILVGAVGAYDWNGAVLKETRHGKVVPPKSSYLEEFPEELKNHGAYLGYTVNSVVSAKGRQLYVAGAPRFNHTGKVIIFTLRNNGNLTILHSLKGQQIGSYYGSELAPLDIDGDGVTDFLLVAAPMFFSKGWERGKVYIYRVTQQNHFLLEGTLEVSDQSQNSRFGGAMAPIPDMNGDSYSEVVVGAPLEDDHQGAIYLFYGQLSGIHHKYRQRIGAAGFSAGLQYFGRSVHGMMDVNEDGLVDLAVGALGAAVLIWSRSVVRIQGKITFEPEKINTFNKDCRRGGKDVTCMSAIVCISLEARTRMQSHGVGVWYRVLIDERRHPPRASLDDNDRQQQSRNLTLQRGEESCEHVHFYVQETADYGHPIVFVVKVGLQSPDQGPVLDHGWPTTFRTEIAFWNGCEGDDSCVPDLILHSRTDLLDRRQFCRPRERAAWALCHHQGASVGSERVVEASRRRLVVEARLENQGENAYGTTLNISHSHNLLFSSLIVKDHSDIQIECRAEDRERNDRTCNVSSPFMRSLTQVSFRLEFELSHSVFLDHVRVVLQAASDGEEMSPDDNINNIFHPLKYEADLLFTRDSKPPRFEINSDHYRNKPGSSGPMFNLTYHIQNLGFFPVTDLQFAVDVFAVTKSGNHLFQIANIDTDQAVSSNCVLPNHMTPSHVFPEDLSHVPQLNHSNSMTLPMQCRLNVPAYREVRVTVRGRLHLQALFAVKFKTLELVTAASIELSPSSPVFLHEERPTRHIILEMRKEEDYKIPIWIIVGSTLGGLLLLALLILALWKLGFFNRQKQREEEEEQVGNGKMPEER